MIAERERRDNFPPSDPRIHVGSAIRAVLDMYGRGGLVDDIDTTDSERAIQESRENPQLNESGLITCLEFTGNVQGRMLIEAGMDASLIPDPLRDYFVQAWVIGNYVIKVQMAPSPRKRHPYFVTSFEKVPGTPVGNGLPDILSDIQDAGNAALRALINNLSIASGPQVVINDDRLAPDEDGEALYRACTPGSHHHHLICRSCGLTVEIEADDGVLKAA